MTSAVRTVLATLALVVGMLAVAAPPSQAAPVERTTGTCHSFSVQYKNWVDFKVENIACAHAHNVGRTWANSCHRSSSTRPLHCQVTETIDGHATTFHCANTKPYTNSTYYDVHCHDSHGKKVSLKFFPHGF